MLQFFLSRLTEDAVVSFEQEAYQFFNDNGTEISSTMVAGQDTPIVFADNTNVRLRILINTLGDADLEGLRLEYSVNAGPWKVVT